MLTLTNSVTFTKGKAPIVLLRNFYEPEDGFVWSNSRWCQVLFSLTERPSRPNAPVDLLFDIDVFKAPPALPGQSVLVYLNGMRVASFDVSQRMNAVIPIASTLLRPQENEITFDTPDAAKPSDFGVLDDRKLGIQLFSLQLRPAD